MIEVIAGLIGFIAGLVKDKAPTVGDVLKAAQAILQSGDDGLDELEKLTIQVKGFVEEGREPTSEEWAELKARKDAALSKIK